MLSGLLISGINKAYATTSQVYGNPTSSTNSVMNQMYGENWGITLILSALLTWGIGLTPPLLIRFLFIRRPMGKGWAIGISAIFWFINIIIFTALGSTSKTHGALFLVACASYAILRKGHKKILWAAQKGNPRNNQFGPNPKSIDLRGTDPNYNETELSKSLKKESKGIEQRTDISGNNRNKSMPETSKEDSTIIDEKFLYKQAWNELEENNHDIGLWAKVYSICDGEEKKARALYLKERVLELKKQKSDKKKNIASKNKFEKETETNLVTSAIKPLSVEKFEQTFPEKFDYYKNLLKQYGYSLQQDKYRDDKWAIRLPNGTGVMYAYSYENLQSKIIEITKGAT